MSTEPPILLDADFVSSFAWVDRMDIIEGLYSKRMVVLEEVMLELERTRHLADAWQNDSGIWSRQTRDSAVSEDARRV